MELQQMRIIYTDIAELKFEEKSSLLQIKVLEDAEMSLEKTKKHYEAIKLLTKNKKYVALVDASNYFSIEPETLTYCALPEVTANRIACAHYNSETANTLTTNFFKNYYNPAIPLRVFEDRKQALTWLRTFLIT